MTILVNRSCTVTFGHFGVVFTQDKGDMTKYRFVKTKCIINQALTRSVGKMFFSADNVADFHGSIVDNYRIIVSRDTVGFNDYEIADTVGIKSNSATNQVVNYDLLVSRNTETNSRFATFCFISSDLFRSQVTTFAHITRHFAFFNQCLTFFFQFFVSAVAVVCFAFSKKLVSVFFVQDKTFSLTIRTIRTANINTFIPIHTKPFQCSFNVFFGFTARTFQVGIFNSQNQFAASFASQQPVEKCRTCTANMERASGAGRKSYSYFITHVISLQKIHWFVTKNIIIILYYV